MKEALSLSIQLKKHIAGVEANYSRVQYYKKHFAIVSYIELFGIFTVNTILTEMREDRILSSHNTVSKFCRYLMIDKFLNFIIIQTRFKRDCQLYWLNTVSAEEITRMINYYEQINRPRKSQSNRNSRENKKLYQKTLDAHTIQSLAHRDARKSLQPLKQKDQEEEEKHPTPSGAPRLTVAEHKMLYEMQPDSIQSFNKCFHDIQRQYYKNRLTMGETEAKDLFQQSKNKLLHNLLEDQEQNI